MTDLHDLIKAWRTYRRMLDIDGLSKQHYQRLIDDLALVIRRRLGR